MDIPATLVVTNDLPPRLGGVQRYVDDLLRHLPAERLTVLAPNWPGWAEHDAASPYRVVRTPQRLLAPTGDLAARVRALADEVAAQVVLFTQGFPSTALGPGVARRGRPYVVLTHGYELWFARLPVTRALLRAALSAASWVFSVSAYTAAGLRPVMPVGVPLSLAPPGVDVERFRPGRSGDGLRERFGLEGRRVIACVSRLVRRKGQDVLIAALPSVLARVPEAALLLVGEGPDEARLRALAGSSAARDRIVFAGALPEEALPLAYAAGDVFAMPCRSRFAGLEVEGFGIVFLEAAAAGLPSVAGRSGGAAEAVVDGETGIVVDGADPHAVAGALARILEDPALAAAMGEAGRARVEARFTWDRTAGRVAQALADAAR